MKRLYLYFCLLTFLGCGAPLPEHVRTDSKVKRSAQSLENTSLEVGWREMTFKRLNLRIPVGWDVISNPNSPPGAEALRIISKDNKLVLFISIWPAKGPVKIGIATQQVSRRFIVQMSADIKNRCSNCTIGGGGVVAKELWGHKGVLYEFDVQKNAESLSKKNSRKLNSERDIYTDTNLFMRLKVFGEHISDSDDVMYISVALEGVEPHALEEIVRSIKVMANLTK